MKLDAGDRTVRKILNTYFFFIPRFQRPYSWKVENVEELWEDAIQESPNDYFIGSMVVYPHSKITVAVIDGQQRLTTLMMLLVAIRNAADKIGDKTLADGTHSAFIERIDENNDARFVLTTETSAPFLQDEILSRGAPELGALPGREELAIKAAFDRLTKYVENAVSEIEDSDTIPEDKKKERVSQKLKSLREKVLDLQLIFVEVGDKDDATTIFVTLNSRGKDLDAGDLVKAHLLQLLPKKGGLDRPREKWDSILAKFDETPTPLSVTEFILAMWRSRYGNTTERTIHKDVRREIKAKNAKSFLDEAVHDAELFRVISDVDYRKWKREANECKASLRFFHNFGVRQPMPLLLSLLREFEAERIKLRQMIRALRAIENYHFAWTILSQKTSSGGMSGFFAKKARLLKASNTVQQNAMVVDDLVKDLSQKRPDPVEFDAAFSSLWFTTEKPDDKKIIQYILERLHKQAKPKSASSFDQMTIEHLDPQENAAAHVGKLGNLVYVSEALNGQLGNKAWPAKKKILANATEWIPDDVKKASQVDDAFILKRTADLAVLARTKVWSGP